MQNAARNHVNVIARVKAALREEGFSEAAVERGVSLWTRGYTWAEILEMLNLVAA